MGDHGSSSKVTLGSGVRFFMILGRFPDPIFKAFRVLLAQIRILFHACFQVVFLQTFEFESGRLGFLKQAFGVRWVAKTKFSQKSEF